MAIFTPVQTTMMAASPVQRSCPAVSKVGPLVPIMLFITPCRKPPKVVQLRRGDVSRNAGVDLKLKQQSLAFRDRHKIKGYTGDAPAYGDLLRRRCVR